MFLVMGVTLYTSRIVLEQLGASDYGVYSIVGGVVTMFAFFNSAMSSATQRYMAYDLGKNDKNRLQRTFSATLTIHFGIAILILLLAETIGLWYVNHKLVLPPKRLLAANVVYQFSVATSLIEIIQVPYDALIISHERMNVYAYISILEAGLRLGAVFLLIFYGGDKLIAYAVLVFLSLLIIRLTYQVYCRKHFAESKYKYYYDKAYYRELISYSGWNLFGNIATVARGQGLNLVLNLFFGTIVNAAYGLTLQVQGAVNLFVANFQKAVNPQIIKAYSQNDLRRTNKLIFQSSKFSFFLLFFIFCPILFNTEFILKLWLKTPPLYTTSFVQLGLIGTLIESISRPLMTGAQATGKIKWYQIVVGSLMFLNLPISFLWSQLTKKPEVVFYTIISINILSLLFRLWFLYKILSFNLKIFFIEVIIRVVIVLCIIILPLVYLFNIGNFVSNDFVKIVIAFGYSGMVILFVGINRREFNLIKSLFSKDN